MPAKQQQRPITAEDLFNIDVVSDPQASPDGTRVAYVVTAADKERDGYRSAIRIVPTGGGEPWMLTSGAFRDTSPRWSPDGKTIAFISDRPLMTPLPEENGEAGNEQDKKGKKSDGKEAKSPSQIWTISVAGGEARQLTAQRHGAESPVWSPDASTIAFVAQVDAKQAEGEQPETIADERIIRKIRYRFNGAGYLDRFRHLFTIPAGGGEATQLTSGDNHNEQPAWTPDGHTIVFVSNRRDDREQSSASTIFAIGRDGGDPRQLAPDDASFADPAVSPDGSRVAFVGHLDYRAGSSKTISLWTIPVSGGEVTNHSASYDRSMSDAGMSDVYFSGDTRPVWVSNDTIRGLAASEGATSIIEVGLKSGTVKTVIGGKRRIIAFTPAGDRVVFAAGDMAHPFELFIADADGGHERQLTRHNQAWLHEVTLSEPIALDVTAEDGLPIQAWILPPYGFSGTEGEKHPLILQIHGGPHAMYGYAMFHEMQLMAAQGYAVLFCNPRGSVGYGEEFAATTRGRWGESDMPDVTAALDKALTLGWIDEDRLGVTGGSYGGYLTNWIVGHTDRFKAAVTQRCVANFHSFFGTSDIGYDFGEHEFGGVPWADSAKLLKYSPISYVADITTPLLIVHGEQDLRCPIEQAEQMFTALKYLGREVEFVRIPEENHELSRSGTPSRRLARLHHLIDWFDRHMPACGAETHA